MTINKCCQKIKLTYFTLTSAKVPGSCFKFTHVMYITDSTSLKTRFSFLVIFISSMKPWTSVLLKKSVSLAKIMRKKISLALSLSSTWAGIQYTAMTVWPSTSKSLGVGGQLVTTSPNVITPNSKICKIIKK